MKISYKQLNNSPRLQYIWLFQELYKAFLQARKHKTKTQDYNDFAEHETENIQSLVHTIVTRKYIPSRGVAFVVHDPVEREIFAAPFRDRVVHHFLYNQNAEWWDRRFIYDSYSCRVGRGASLAVSRLHRMERRASLNFTKQVYIFKGDIQSFFMSLDRARLYAIVLEGLKKQYPNGGFQFRVCKFLWYQVIMDDPTINVRRRGPLSDWDIRNLPFNKSLFNQPIGQGIVIGNLTSQLLSNIYLDQLDKFIKNTLGYKFYGRYVDDFFILVTEDEKEQFFKDLRRIEAFLTGLGLTLHPKKRYFQPIEKGVHFVGATIYPRAVIPGKRLRNNSKRAFQEVIAGKRKVSSVPSYLGLMSQYDSGAVLTEIFEKVGWNYNL